MAELVAACWAKYLAKLDKQPIRTKALTAALLAGLSDVIAQRLSRRATLNWRRTLTVALYGLVWGGPSNHYWQLFLERAVPRRRGDALRPLKKVALEQLTWGPLNNALLMLYLAKAVEGRSWAATWRATAANFGGVQRSGWRLWPAASLVNQTFVPLELRVLWMNAVALVWSTFLISRARPSGGLPPRLPPR